MGGNERGGKVSKFLSHLEVELVDDKANDGRGSWRLLRDLVYQSDVALETFTVPAGFVTDFASVPRVPFAFLLCGDSCHAAAALHDFLYTAPHLVSRCVADDVLHEAAHSTGVPSWRCWLVWAGVRLGGASHFNPEPIPT